jgi:hypothetical protein
MDLKSLSMSELIAHYNTLAQAKGVSPVTEFKNLAAGRAAITQLEMKMENQAVQVETDPATAPFEEGTDALVAAALAAAGTAASGDANKYSTVGKRGPNQGIGEFAKQLLTQGVSTGDVLAKVKEQFPTAKTSASCIAYYKAALKNPNLGKRKAVADPVALRAKAQELLAAATAAEQAAVQAAADAAAKAKALADAAEAAAQAAATQTEAGPQA